MQRHVALTTQSAFIHSFNRLIKVISGSGKAAKEGGRPGGTSQGTAFFIYIVYYAEAAQSNNYTGKYTNIHAYMPNRFKTLKLVLMTKNMTTPITLISKVFPHTTL